MKKNPLSTELKLATEIFGYHERDELAFFGEVLDGLTGEISRSEAYTALDTLAVWGIRNWVIASSQ